MNALVDSAEAGIAWASVLGVAAAAGLLLDGRFLAADARTRIARVTAVAALAASALWAWWLAWSGAPTEALRRWESAAWWASVLPVLWLGAFSAHAGGPRAVTRLAAVQAVPAILLSFTPALGWRAAGAVAAGLARLAVPPLHPMNLAAAESLPPGAFLLLAVFGLVVGGPVAVAGVANLPASAASWLVTILALAAGFAGAASLRDADLHRRIATWAAVQGALAVAVTALAELTVGRSPVRAALAHLGAVAAAMPLLVLSIGRVTTWVRVADLRAHGGLGREAPRRARALVAVALLAVLASSRAAGSLVAEFGTAEPVLTRAAVVLALVGWFGANLALVLGAYRVTRGRRPAPGEPVPEIRIPELTLHLALAAALLAFWHFPDLWRLPIAWRDPGVVPPVGSP